MSLKYTSAFGCALLLLGGCAATRTGTPVRPDLGKSAVLLRPEPNAVQELAAAELARHLGAAAGREIPVLRGEDAAAHDGYAFRVGVRAPADDLPFLPEEGRYRVTDTAAYFYGDDLIQGGAAAGASVLATDGDNRLGTLFAVYEFLDRECGMRCTMPGEIGLVYLKSGDLELQPGSVSWRPPLQRRLMYAHAWDWSTLTSVQAGIPEELRIDRETAAERHRDELAWLRRQRLGRHAPDASPDNAASPREALPAVFRSTALAEHIGLPLGREKLLFDRFQASLKRGVQGTETSLPSGSWWLDGLAAYVLARAQAVPGMPFGTWEHEFCTAFGAAFFDVEQYYRFWRAHFEEKIAPNRDSITEAGWGNWARGLCRNILDYYSFDDFRASLAHLHNALTRDLTDRQRDRLQALLLAHEHAELTFLALEAAAREQSGKPGKLSESLEWAQRLTAFRADFGTRLNMCLPRLVEQEIRLGDLACTQWAALFKDAKPVRALPLIWSFRTDPDDIGCAEKWYKLSKEDLQDWDAVRVDRPWNRQSTKEDPTTAQLQEYSGIAWYAAPVSFDSQLEGKKVFLNFQGLTGACQVYLDGKKSDEHLCREAGPAETSFRLRLDLEGADLAKKHMLIVRVDARASAPSGIWRPLWLSVLEPPTAEAEEQQTQAEQQTSK